MLLRSWKESGIRKQDSGLYLIVDSCEPTPVGEV